MSDIDWLSSRCQGNRIKMALIVFKEPIKPIKSYHVMWIPLFNPHTGRLRSDHRPWRPNRRQAELDVDRTKGTVAHPGSCLPWGDGSLWQVSSLFSTFWIDKVRKQNLFRERIPERVVHAKGAGAFGYFEVSLFLALSFNLIDEDRKWGPSFFSFSFCLTPSLLNFNTSRAQNYSCYFTGHPWHLQVLQSSSLQQGIVTRTTITIVCSLNRERVQLWKANLCWAFLNLGKSFKTVRTWPIIPSPTFNIVNTSNILRK